MDDAALQFLATQRVSVVGILQEDQSVHSATLHFAYNEEYDTFYVLTDKSSRKCRPLLAGDLIQASIVIGFDEHNCQTYQSEGVIKIVQDAEDLQIGWDTYGGKYPERAGARDQDTAALLAFSPSWMRFSGLDTKKKFNDA